MNFFYDLPDELIEYIFNIMYREKFDIVLEELKERTKLRNNERVEECVEHFINNLIDNVLQNLNNQL